MLLYLVIKGGFIISRILFLAPNPIVYDMAKEIFSKSYPNIFVEHKVLYEAVETARSYLDRGVEIVISRGNTTVSIKNNLPVSVVEIPITNNDIIRAVEKARQYGPKVTIIAYPSIFKSLEPLVPFLGLEVRSIEINNLEDSKSAVLQAFKEGADVVLGGGTTESIAKELNLPAVSIQVSKEGILEAVEQAKVIERALTLEKIRKSEISTILDYTSEGIITTDVKNIITTCNPAASKLIQIERNYVVGQDIDKVLPQLELKKTINFGQSDLHQIIKINDIHILCKKIPVTINENTIGAVVTMQDISEISDMEAHIRKEVYSKGHIARFTFNNIIGKSSKSQQSIITAKKYAQTNSNVLITGESGTGKELFAQSIHNASFRSKGPFVAINCAALPQNILESELFGYVGGAFTGASKNGKPGLFELGHKGTVFLDEIAELSLENQGRLLRVLQEKTIMRLGADNVIPVDVRIISATNKSLRKMVQEGTFRDDLYYRLNVLRLSLSPLRECDEDVEIIAPFYLSIYARELNKTLRLSNEAIKWLQSYSWPGNIREVKNLMERIAAISTVEIIEVEMLEALCDEQFSDNDSTNEKKIIIDTLYQVNGNHTKASQILGVHRSTLWRKMKKYNI